MKTCDMCSREFNNDGMRGDTCPRCLRAVVVNSMLNEAEEADEDDDPSEIPTEPEEGDWVTEDHKTFTQHEYPNAWRDRIVVKDDRRWAHEVEARMKKDQFWPSVWFISDHGNCHLIDMFEALHSEDE